MGVKLTTNNFDTEVLNSDIPVLVDFWAPWCGPCKIISPYIEELAKEYKGKIKVGKINIDEASELATKYMVMSIPTIMIFQKGKVMEKRVGAMSKNDLLKLVSSYFEVVKE